MPITVSPKLESHDEHLAYNKFFVEATDTVDTHCASYLILRGSTIDADYLLDSRLTTVMRDLDELDEIVSEAHASYVPTPDLGGHYQHTIKRAAELAAAIREALTLAATPRRTTKGN